MNPFNWLFPNMTTQDRNVLALILCFSGLIGLAISDWMHESAVHRSWQNTQDAAMKSVWVALNELAEEQAAILEDAGRTGWSRRQNSRGTGE